MVEGDSGGLAAKRVVALPDGPLGGSAATGDREKSQCDEGTNEAVQ